MEVAVVGNSRDMALPKHDRELSLWLVKECMTDFEEMGYKMREMMTGLQMMPRERERLLDREFGDLHSVEGRKKRLIVEGLTMDGLMESSHDVIHKLIEFNPLLFARDTMDPLLKERMA